MSDGWDDPRVSISVIPVCLTLCIWVCVTVEYAYFWYRRSKGLSRNRPDRAVTYENKLFANGSSNTPTSARFSTPLFSHNGAASPSASASASTSASTSTMNETDALESRFVDLPLLTSFSLALVGFWDVNDFFGIRREKKRWRPLRLFRLLFYRSTPMLCMISVFLPNTVDSSISFGVVGFLGVLTTLLVIIGFSLCTTFAFYKYDSFADMFIAPLPTLDASFFSTIGRKWIVSFWINLVLALAGTVAVSGLASIGVRGFNFYSFCNTYAIFVLVYFIFQSILLFGAAGMYTASYATILRRNVLEAVFSRHRKVIQGMRRSDATDVAVDVNSTTQFALQQRIDVESVIYLIFQFEAGLCATLDSLQVLILPFGVMFAATFLMFISRLQFINMFPLDAFLYTLFVISCFCIFIYYASFCAVSTKQLRILTDTTSSLLFADALPATIEEKVEVLGHLSHTFFQLQNRTKFEAKVARKQPFSAFADMFEADQTYVTRRQVKCSCDAFPLLTQQERALLGEILEYLNDQNPQFTVLGLQVTHGLLLRLSYTFFGAVFFLLRTVAKLNVLPG
eukprot:ANDGO_02065.mRNA.1 hypothetical protein